MRIALTAVIAVVFALLASFGVYQAAQPAAQQTQAPISNYGSR